KIDDGGVSGPRIEPDRLDQILRGRPDDLRPGLAPRLVEEHPRHRVVGRLRLFEGDILINEFELRWRDGSEIHLAGKDRCLVAGCNAVQIEVALDDAQFPGLRIAAWPLARPDWVSGVARLYRLARLEIGELPLESIQR